MLVYIEIDTPISVWGKMNYSYHLPAIWIIYPNLLWGHRQQGTIKRLLPEETSVCKGPLLAPSWDREKPPGHTTCPCPQVSFQAIFHPHASCSNRLGCSGVCLPTALGEWSLPICSFQGFLKLPSRQEMHCWPPSPCVSIDSRSLASWPQSQQPQRVESGRERAVLSCQDGEDQPPSTPSSSCHCRPAEMAEKGNPRLSLNETKGQRDPLVCSSGEGKYWWAQVCSSGEGRYWWAQLRGLPLPSESSAASARRAQRGSAFTLHLYVFISLPSGRVLWVPAES